MSENIFRRKYEREKRIRREAETLLEDKSHELFNANEDLRRMLANTEKLVSQRTREYKDATRKAESADRSKSEFLATVSHEIRTPLNGIIGSLSIVREQIKNIESRPHIEIAFNSANALLRLINDILDLSKIEAGHMEIEYQTVNLVSSISSVIDLFSSKAIEKQLRLVQSIDDDFPQWWIADEGRVKQILSNYLSNAIKFSDQGEIRVDLLINDRGYVEIRVADTGIGIPEEKLPLLFTDFQQVDASYKRRFGGTGLGLSICRKLCELMGGDVGVTSIPGHGSTFWAQFPFEQGEELEMTSSEKIREEPARLSGHVLMAEDSGTNALVAQAMMRLKDLQVTHVFNGRDAVSAWRAGAFDLILMDLAMPEMDGFEATKEIRAEEKNTTPIPILALTANVSEKDLQSCLDVGMNGIISKPIIREDFFKELSRWLTSDDDIKGIVNLGTDYTKINIFNKTKFSSEWQDLPISVQVDILKLFLDEMSERENRIKKLWKKEIWEPLVNEAHALKSASGNVGCERLFTLSRDIENVLQEKSYMDAEKLLKNINSVCIETLRQVQNQVQFLECKISRV